MSQARITSLTDRRFAAQHALRATAALLILVQTIPARADFSALQSSYRFLVGERAAAGVLYSAGAGELRGRQLPLSFSDSAAYWGEYVCQSSRAICAIEDIYDARSYTLTPQKPLTSTQNDAGDLQTERVNVHNGINIYDAATWQIAVMLGDARDRYELAGNQNRLLHAGYSGDASHPAAGQNRATSNGEVFIYNGRVITDAKNAYAFRTLPRNWLSADPFIDSKYAQWIKTSDLPLANPEYRKGMISWTDWKPISGENAWAFLIGPLQAAYIHYIVDNKQSFVPFQDLAVQNALNLLPTFAAMQAPIGAIYYAPAGTLKNLGQQLVDPHEVAVENSFSLYAGLTILRATLSAELTHQKLTAAERAIIDEALRLSAAMIDGGTLDEVVDGDKKKPRSTAGLLSFFKNFAWRDGEFVQGGSADAAGETQWRPALDIKAVDVNTWGISTLGAAQIDAWFGAGAAYRNWQRVKSWAAYGAGKTLWGVGFSNLDGNGIDADGNYRQGILSAEWSAGAINMLRALIAHYRSVDTADAGAYVAALSADEQAMLNGMEKMRIDNYARSGLPGQPPNYAALLSVQDFIARRSLPYLYASKRYPIPFGWYANPLPSTCATAWVIMLANRYDPFVYGGRRERGSGDKAR